MRLRTTAVAIAIVVAPVVASTCVALSTTALPFARLFAAAEFTAVAVPLVPCTKAAALVTALVTATAPLVAFPVPITLSGVLLSAVLLPAEVALIVAPPMLVGGAVALFTAIIIVLERLA